MTKSGHMTIRNAVDKRRFLMIFDHLDMPFSLSWVIGESRTKAQNRLVHRWFADVSKHFGDTTAEEVKAQCNMQFGVPILRRDDEEWCAEFDSIIRPLGYEMALRAIQVFDIPFTRRMTTAQLSEYMDNMQRHFLGLGVTLTDPEARKYEEDMR